MYSFVQQLMEQIASAAIGAELPTEPTLCGTVTCICSDFHALTERRPRRPLGAKIMVQGGHVTPCIESNPLTACTRN